MLKTLERFSISLLRKAKGLTKICHLSVLISFHSPRYSLCSSHTSFCHPLKVPTLLLPQGLCTCSLCLHSFPPVSCVPHCLSLSGLFSNIFKCEFPDHAIWKHSPPLGAPSPLPWLDLLIFYSTAPPKCNILHDLLILFLVCIKTRKTQSFVPFQALNPHT